MERVGRGLISNLSSGVPLAAAMGWAVGGPSLAGQSVLWAMAAIANFGVLALLTRGLARAASAGDRPPVLSWAAKAPITLVVLFALARFVDPRAMVLGIAAAAFSLVFTGLRAPAVVT